MPVSSSYSRMSRLSAIITILPASMAAGWALGYYFIDKTLMIFPWGSIIATLAGAAAGFYEIFLLLTREKSGDNGPDGKP